jgi:hypothetical protein
MCAVAENQAEKSSRLRLRTGVSKYVIKEEKAGWIILLLVDVLR